MLTASLNWEWTQFSLCFKAINSLDCLTALIQASFLARDGIVTALFEKAGLEVSALRSCLRAPNFSLPPQRNTPNGVSLGSLLIFRESMAAVLFSRQFSV